MIIASCISNKKFEETLFDSKPGLPDIMPDATVTAAYLDRLIGKILSESDGGLALPVTISCSPAVARTIKAWKHPLCLDYARIELDYQPYRFDKTELAERIVTKKEWELLHFLHNRKDWVNAMGEVLHITKGSPARHADRLATVYFIRPVERVNEINWSRTR